MDTWKHMQVWSCRAALRLVPSVLERQNWGESWCFERRLLRHNFGSIPGPAVWLPLPVASTTGVVLLAVGTSCQTVHHTTGGQWAGSPGVPWSLGVLGVSGACYGMMFLLCLHIWEYGSCCCDSLSPPPGIACGVSQPGWVPRQLPFPTSGSAGGCPGPHGGE